MKKKKKQEKIEKKGKTTAWRISASEWKIEK